jgi:CRISPR-associated protein Cas1
MGTIYITQEESFIGKTDERLQVKAEKKTLLDVPLIKVDGVVVLGRSTISPAALMELLQRQIPLSFLTVNGKYLGRLEPQLTKNIFVRSAQWKVMQEPAKVTHVVRGFVRGKLKNYRNSFLRAQRENETLNLQDAITRL